MSLAEARYHLVKTRQKYVLMRLTEILLQSASITFFILSITVLLSIKGTSGLLFSLAAALIYFIHQARSLEILQVTNTGIVNYLNRSYPVMEGGADLMLIEDEQLTSIQQLQKSRAIQQFESLYHSIKLPNNLKKAIILFSASALIYFVTASSGLIKPNTEISDTTAPVTIMSKSDLAVIKGISVTVAPPTYTNIATRSTNNFNLRIPEGSLIQWNVDFKGEVADPKIIFSGNDSLSLTGTNSSFRAQRSFTMPAFYQLRWRNNDGSIKSSDYYEIAVIKDQPPAISVENLNQFTEYDFASNLKTDLRSTITDDYGLRDAYIIATVSKGSGEAIKFRELRVGFDKPATVSGTSVQANLAIDLIKLGLEPGDELYFYVEALDNKNPMSNRARTETFFISLRDTSSQATMADPGLGVDLMPEYFRSQRQIIIDSEKLLKEKKHITKDAFNSRSNSLAHDQKVLRLRYGEFLGEEFESGIGLQTEAHADGGEDKDDDVSKQYGHVHDRENEHNLVDDKKSPTRDSHDHKNDNDKDNDPLKDYLHAHDSQEEATFFTQSIRSKLKAAITIMWDAELHLRLYDPEKSLPFQYRALKLLKEISQDSRIYVHRTGFDPPPLKEEKRLMGDLAEIKNSKTARESHASEDYPGIRKALRTIDQLLGSETITVNTESKAVFEDAGQELASIAIQQPGRYLRTLSSLKSISQDEIDSAQMLPTLIEIRKVLWNVLPLEIDMPQATSRSSTRLDEQFLNNLERLKQQ